MSQGSFRFRFPATPTDVDLKNMTIAQVCACAVTNPRRVRYLVSIGAVPPPHGKTFGARYTWGHVLKIRDLNSQTAKKQISAREAAEVRLHGFRKNNGHVHLPGTGALEGATRAQLIYNVTDTIYIVAPYSPSAIERGIVQRVVRNSRLTEKEHTALLKEFAASMHKESAKKRSNAKAERSISGDRHGR